MSTSQKTASGFIQRLFWKKDDDTWLPTKQGVRFFKREVKTLVEALAKAL